MAILVADEDVTSLVPDGVGGTAAWRLGACSASEGRLVFAPDQRGDDARAAQAPNASVEMIGHQQAPSRSIASPVTVPTCVAGAGPPLPASPGCTSAENGGDDSPTNVDFAPGHCRSPT
jgi:hypothetical protein